MKKSIFLLAGVLLLVSCGEKFYSVTISNSSTKTVSYDYNGISDSLAPSTTKTYEVKAYTQPPRNVVDNSDKVASIAIKSHQGEKYTFTDVEELKLIVKNNLPFQITIRAGNYIKSGTSTELTIPADQTNSSSPNAVIYTRKPRFTANTDHPITIDWSINAAANANDPDEMVVTIK